MPEKIYLNTASCGLLSKESVEATHTLYEGMQTDASHAVEPLRDSGIERIRNKVASFIEAPASSIALIPNFSWGLNAVVRSLKGNEKVLLYNNDYPSLIAPFSTHGFEISWIEDEDGFDIDSEKLKAHLLKEKIDILAISHVQWLTGFKIDIDDIGGFCKQHNIFFILDATQSLGAVPIHLSRHNIDVLIASNYKWMNAGFGTGIMYVSERFGDTYPPVIGSNNFKHRIPDYVPSVKNFEPGHLNLHGLLVLEKALDYKLHKGIKNIETHNQTLLQTIAKNTDPSLILGSPDIKHRSSIIVLKDPGNLFDHLTNNGIVAIKRGNKIRLGVHFYNCQEETKRLVGLLAS